MSRFLRLAAPALMALVLANAATAEPFKDAFPDLYSQLDPAYQGDVGALELRHGTVKLEGGAAEIALPDSYYFLDAKDARYVMEKLWENPPSDTTLGMIFPKDGTPFDPTAWAATLEFDPMGYVSDEDATSYDYAEMLKNMQDAMIADNPQRIKDGFGSVELLGWAAEPHYDSESRKLYWAKRLRFDGGPDETLNYNIRILGRKGVLVVNFIAGMDLLPKVEAAAPEVLKIINFTEGNRYADFVPGVDTVAAVGIGGLIAGQVAAKTGFLVLALAFLKKGFVIVLVFAAAIWRKIKSGLAGRKAGNDEDGPVS